MDLLLLATPCALKLIIKTENYAPQIWTYSIYMYIVLYEVSTTFLVKQQA